MLTIDKQQAIKKLISELRRTSYKAHAQVSDARILGLLISRYLDWDGALILEAAEAALEDANFHFEAGKIRRMRDNVQHGNI